MFTIALRIITALEVLLFIKRFRKEYKDANVLYKRQKYDNSIYDSDRSTGSDVLDDVPIESRAYQNYHQTKSTDND